MENGITKAAKRLRIRIIGFSIGLAIAAIWWWQHDQHRPCPTQPLQVEMIDDGGANLKVESTVDCK